jgi:hypothetical protein
VDFDGSYAATIKLTKDDIEQLQTVLGQIASSDRKAAAALQKKGAHIIYTSAKRLGAIEPGPGWREVGNITLSREWKGGDDLRQIAEFATLERVFVTQSSRVTDKALDELRKRRPEIVVDRVPDAFLGIESAPELDDARGISIREVVSDSPADRAGLRINDVLIEIAGKPVPGFAALRKLMHPLRPGQKVSLKVLRDDQPLSLTVELGDRN